MPLVSDLPPPIRAYPTDQGIEQGQGIIPVWTELFREDALLPDVMDEAASRMHQDEIK